LLFTGRCYREALIPCICRTSPVEKSIALVVWSAPNVDPSALCTRRTARAHPQGAATIRFSAIISSSVRSTVSRTPPDLFVSNYVSNSSSGFYLGSQLC